jgi:kinesin family member C1
MVMACIIPNMDGQSGKTIQSLPDTLSSLMGFNKYLTPTWIESVSHIIKELSPAKPKMEVMVRKELSPDRPKMEVMVQKAQHDGPDDTEPEVKVAMIQGMQIS